MDSRKDSRKLFTRIAVALALMGIGFLAYRAYGWPGLALAAGGVVMWMLLHMTRMLKVLQRAAQQPVGSVASAVMLQSRLAQGMTLLQVLGFAGALGQPMGEPGGSPERYQWADASAAAVLCTFDNGKLTHWELLRA